MKEEVEGGEGFWQRDQRRRQIVQNYRFKTAGHDKPDIIQTTLINWQCCFYVVVLNIVIITPT